MPLRPDAPACAAPISRSARGTYLQLRYRFVAGHFDGDIQRGSLVAAGWCRPAAVVGAAALASDALPSPDPAGTPPRKAVT